MSKAYQKTLTQPVSFEGVGLHSGKQSKVTIFPSNEDAGIIFKRVDLKSNNIIEANFKNVSNAKLCTTLQNKNNIKYRKVIQKR